MFALYVDDLSKQLIDARSGCFIEYQCINHVLYADDICLLAPSTLGLQKLLMCAIILVNVMILFLIFLNHFVLCLDLKDISYFIQLFLFIQIGRIPETKYLGYLLSQDQSDDEDIAKQMHTV